MSKWRIFLMIVTFGWLGRKRERPPKDIYRWMQVHPDLPPFWMIVGLLYADGSRWYLPPPDVTWLR